MKYEEYLKRRNDENLADLHVNDFADAKNYLINKGIHCVKYNYSFANDTSSNSQRAFL